MSALRYTLTSLVKHDADMYAMKRNALILKYHRALIYSLYSFAQVDSSRESAEAACDILSQLVHCSLKTLGLISTARPSFMELPKVSTSVIIHFLQIYLLANV